MKVFFNTDQSKTVLARFRPKLEGIAPESDFDKQRNALIRLVLQSMENGPDQWDEQCQVNIGWIGNHLIRRLSDEGVVLDKENLDDICSICFRFLFELYLSMKNDLSMEFESARRFVFNNLDDFEDSAKEQIEYAIREMPIAIFKQIANSDEISRIKEFNNVVTKANELKKKWDKEISDKEDKVTALKSSLEKYENAFNFVGLYQGFDDLSKEKKDEKNNILFWLKILSVLIISPIIGELIFIYLNIDNISKTYDGLLVTVFPTISLAAISIYYFRVLLFNYKSVKSQLLQIDLRKTLCRFIQNYSDYSQDMKKQDSESLAKFENIIFSRIVSDEDKLPSTYDGIEQIGKLIQSAKK